MTEQTLPADSPAGLEIALGSIASGVTLVMVADGREDVGVTVSAFCPISLRPALVLISLMEESYPAELLGRIDRFAVTVLGSGQRVLAGRFTASGRPGARLALDDVRYHRGASSGALIVDDGLASMECEVVNRVPAGDHLLVIGRVLAVSNLADTDQPLVRFRGRYAALAGT